MNLVSTHEVRTADSRMGRVPHEQRNFQTALAAREGIVLLPPYLQLCEHWGIIIAMLK